MADDVLVMYAGRCVERGDVRTVMSRPQMPYTWGLLSSVPRLSGDVNVPLVPVRGAPPSLIDLPPGCPFHPRCDHAWRIEGDRCSTERPALRPAGNGPGFIACHLDAETRQRIVEEDLLPLWETTIL
jgi:peptide/nickel transport system ATP-binding protein